MLRFGLAGIISLPLAAAVAADPLLFDVAQANPGFDQRTNAPTVTFRFTPESARKFAQFTSENVGRAAEIRLDGKVLSRPVIREPILGGTGQISGSFTVEQARDLAARLAAGTKLEIEAVAN
jgi:preprotein translocase subunit SecD